MPEASSNSVRVVMGIVERVVVIGFALLQCGNNFVVV
jgi:hypothetical protein